MLYKLYINNSHIQDSSVSHTYSQNKFVEFLICDVSNLLQGVLSHPSLLQRNLLLLLVFLPFHKVTSLNSFVDSKMMSSCSQLHFFNFSCSSLFIFDLDSNSFRNFLLMISLNSLKEGWTGLFWPKVCSNIIFPF